MPERKGRIHLFIGLPASGKSTIAKERLKKDGALMRVNRDDIRTMLFEKWKGKKEQVVTAVETSAVKSALALGYSIIIDDTNLNPKTRAGWQTLADQCGVLLVEEKFDTPLEECIRRDALRTGRARVGRPVIENMALCHGYLSRVDKKVVIFDVDGTLADHSNRLVYLQQKPKDYKSYYSAEAILDCKPISSVVEWAQGTHFGGYYNIIVSGRPMDIAGNATCQWLENNQVPYNHIFMRNGGDFRDDTLVKQEILDKLLKWVSKDQILFAVDDRPRIVRMWKENGITCYNVGDGHEF